MNIKPICDLSVSTSGFKLLILEEEITENEIMKVKDI